MSDQQKPDVFYDLNPGEQLVSQIWPGANYGISDLEIANAIISCLQESGRAMTILEAIDEIHNQRAQESCDEEWLISMAMHHPSYNATTVK
jgi:hypothetical protein